MTHLPKNGVSLTPANPLIWLKVLAKAWFWYRKKPSGVGIKPGENAFTLIKARSTYKTASIMPYWTALELLSGWSLLDATVFSDSLRQLACSARLRR